MKASTLKRALGKEEEVCTDTLKDPAGDVYTSDTDPKRSVTISVTGPMSKAVREATEIEDGKAYEAIGDKVTKERVLSRRLHLAAAAVTAWDGVEDEDGTPIECTKENVMMFLAIDTRLLEQVEALVKGHARFFKLRSNSLALTSNSNLS